MEIPLQQHASASLSAPSGKILFIAYGKKKNKKFQPIVVADLYGNTA